MDIKTFIDYVSEAEEEFSKDDIIEILEALQDDTESDLEYELVDLLITLVEEDIVKEYEAIIELLEEFLDDDLEDIVGEAQRPLYKRRGYVKDPRTGRIRKRGNAAKPLDRKRSRMMKKVRKKYKMSFKKGLRKTKRTKKRLGQIK